MTFPKFSSHLLTPLWSHFASLDTLQTTNKSPKCPQKSQTSLNYASFTPNPVLPFYPIYKWRQPVFTLNPSKDPGNLPSFLHLPYLATSLSHQIMSVLPHKYLSLNRSLFLYLHWIHLCNPSICDCLQTFTSWLSLANCPARVIFLKCKVAQVLPLVKCSRALYDSRGCYADSMIWMPQGIKMLLLCTSILLPRIYSTTGETSSDASCITLITSHLFVI